MSNQGARQASVRAVTGTAFTYEGDWHALFDMAEIPVGTFNERMLAWINDYMGESFTELNGAMAAFAIDQGADSWNGLGTFDAGGVVPPVQPLRGVVTQNRGPVGGEGRSGKDRLCVRWPYVIATDTTEIFISNNTWSLNSSSEGTTPDITIQSMSIEANGVVVPVYYGGNRTKFIASGSVDIQSDAVQASAFGLGAFFPKGTLIWIKGIISAAAAGSAISYAITKTGDYSGSQAAWYDSTTSTASSTDVSGLYTLTGGSFDSRSNGYRPIILGRPVSDADTYSVLAVGDSIAAEVSDSGYGLHGAGFICRSSHDGSGSDLIPIINMARSAVPSGASLGANTRGQQYYKYARIGLEEYGENDMNSGLYTNLPQIWANMRGAGIEKIVRTKYPPRTNSSDLWATEANQSYYSSDWQAGGLVEDLHNTFAAYLLDGTLDAVLDNTTIRGVDPYKWRVNGTSRYTAQDGQHPSPNGHALWATELRPVLRSVLP